MFCSVRLLLVSLLVFGLSSLARSGTGTDAKGTLQQMHDYFVNTPGMEFDTSFKVTSDMPSMNRRGAAHFIIQNPDRFRVELSTDKGDYVFISDGKTFTIYRPKKGKFAQLPARDSIIGTMYLAAGLLNIQARFIDFLWTVDYGEDVSVAGGDGETVGDRRCSRFSVDRFEDDWEVWLSPTWPPLPCRLLSKRTDGNAGVVQTNEFTWKATPAISPSTFLFSPPKDSRAVGVSDLD